MLLLLHVFFFFVFVQHVSSSVFFYLQGSSRILSATDANTLLPRKYGDPVEYTTNRRDKPFSKNVIRVFFFFHTLSTGTKLGGAFSRDLKFASTMTSSMNALASACKKNTWLLFQAFHGPF